MNVSLPLAAQPASPPTHCDDPKQTGVTLWFLSGPLRQQEPLRHVPILAQPFIVGRRSDVAFTIPHETVSSMHAELLPVGESLFVQDMGSTNGTYINAKRISGRVEVGPGDLIQFADIPFRVLRQSALTHSATVNREVVVDQALALVHFEQLMETEAVVPHYQPIVELGSERVIGYEVLGRSRMPGLETPAAMFSAAAQLNLEVNLSRMLRNKGIELTRHCAGRPHLFVNTHPSELKQPGLIASIESVRQAHPQQPLTLEIHEAAVADVAEMKRLRAELRDLRVGLAFDDFGAGQARLVELSEVQPDYVKFDISLIRSIHAAPPEHRKMVRSLVAMVADIGTLPLAEGIEERAEAETCLELGFLLAQGFLFGKPAPLLVSDDGRG